MVHGPVPHIMMRPEKLTRTSMKYSLPTELIAQKPLRDRSASRLMTANIATEEILDAYFRDLPDLLMKGDLLVLNDTKVFRARLKGHKQETGGKAEVFLLKDMGENLWKAMVRPGRTAREGTVLDFRQGLTCTVEKRLGNGRALVRFHSSGNAPEVLKKVAEVPLPPYIRRDPEELDDERYQTVYAERTGAVAAPTAGLHFTRELLDSLRQRGVDHTYVTLHVGPGTFQPLRFEELEENVLEPEEYYVPASSLSEMRKTRKSGGRIVAVGTTTTRILESVDIKSEESLSGETDIFIFPPYRFRNVDALITNFHLPESSLLCLVAAFMGYRFMMDAYRHAVDESYRFYSYGDAMLIEGNP